ncbi:MAG: ABC transporter permease [Candidatus Heimdallarchaeaceae archaeon]
MITINKNENLEIERTKTGLRRGFVQIKSTVNFEIKRNLKNFFMMFIALLLIYLMSMAINLIQEGRGADAPEDPVDYIKSYLILIDFLIMIIATTFGGSIIAEDYNSHTGNLIFPKITKGRLFTGRMLARYLLSALSVIIYYLLVGITTAIKYNSLPGTIWISMLWALVYTFLVLSFVAFFSSFMKSTSATVVTSILMILMVFNLVNSILMFTGVTWEPFFILTYYSSIITESFAMPEERYVERALRSRTGSGPTYMSWITPSVTGAIIGMLVYSAILLGFAYYFFRRRQQKQG